MKAKVFSDDDERYARAKFGAQKGISSDEFFSKGSYDPSAQTEAKTRLQGFEGATSISSNAYFGRPEDNIPQADEYGNYGDLEGAARDFVRKFGVTAGDDLENLTNVLGEGATKLRGKFFISFVLLKRLLADVDVRRCYTELPSRLEDPNLRHDNADDHSVRSCDKVTCALGGRPASKHRCLIKTMSAQKVRIGLVCPCATKLQDLGDHPHRCLLRLTSSP